MVETVMQQQNGSQGNGNVVALGVLQILYGSIFLLSGLLVAVFGGAASAMVGKAFADYGGESWGTMGAIVMVFIGLMIMLVGVLPLVSGIGVIKYRQWGRIMTFIMATLALVQGVWALVGGGWEGSILPIGFGVYAWVMLTRPHIAALFQQGQMQQQTIVVETA